MKLNYLVEAGEYDPASGEVTVKNLEQAKQLLKQMIKDILSLRSQLEALTKKKAADESAASKEVD